MFEGFSEKTREFLWGLALNNEKSWFEAHRNEYETALLRPFRALALETAELMQQQFPDDGLRLHISRIYRDARRLHGRGPYKDHLWFSLKSCDGLMCGPAFWFEVGAVDYSCGMGFYSARAEEMAAFRASVAANPAAFLRIAEPVMRAGVFELEGADYKRPKGDLGEPLNAWYNKRWLGLCRTRPFGTELFSPELPGRLCSQLATLMPLYRYLKQFYMPQNREENG